MAPSKKFLQPINLLNAVSDPSPAVSGDFYYNTTSQTIRFYDGTQWNDISGGGSGGVAITVSETAPENPELGDAWFKTSTNELRIYDGTYWVEATSVVQSLFFVSPNPPASPATGTGWFDTDTNEFFIYDGTYWVEVASVVKVDLISDPSPTLGADLNAAGYGLENVDHISFDITSEYAVSEGELAWNAREHTLDLGLGNGVVLQIGEEFFMPKVLNNSGVTIPNGSFVMATGAQGDQITIAKAITDGSVDPMYMIGVASREILNGDDEGRVCVNGIVRNVNTAAWTVGTVLYPDPSVAGGLTSTAPQAPNIRTPIAIVLRQHVNTGQIYVRMTNGSVFGGTDSNVKFTSISDNDIVTYNATQGLWVNQNLASAIGEVDGSGSGIDADLLDGEQGSHYTGYADSAVSTHNNDTTDVHGISNTANLVYTNDSRLSDARTPTSHALTHGPGGTDEITIAQSQVTNLTTDISAKAPINNPTFTGSVTLAQDPTQALHAATKQYVDSVAEGLHIHASVSAATTENITDLSSPPATIDGVTLTEGMRILVKNQSSPAQNGIYVLTSGALVRASDYNSASEIQAGDFVFVSEGTTWNNTGWVQENPVATLGTDPIVWSQFSGAGTYTAGTGLSLTGFQFANTGVLSISGTADEVEVSASTGAITIGLPATINANTTGNAATASKLGTARSIALSGDVTGSANFDGSAGISITATVVDDSHNHIIGNVDGLQDALDLKAPLASPTLTGTPSAPTASPSTNTTQIATTAFVQAAISGFEALPSQTGQSGKYLTTNGTVASWGAVQALPTQTGNEGKYLTTDGTNASWETVQSGSIQTDIALSNSWWLGV